MEKYLRSWRQDALNKGQHDAAIYIGDKVLALSNNDSDAFWLAQVHFSNNNYTRALALLSRRDLVTRSLSCRYLASHCHIKQGRYDNALSLLGDENPVHFISTAQHNARRKLAHLNGNVSRHVTHRGKGPRDRIEYSEERERDREQEKELKFQAGMCYLRGLCFSKRNAFERAKDCYMTAVRIDIQCFEAFDQLMRNSLLSPAEEIAFLQELDFDSIRTDDPAIAQEAAHFTKLLYTTRLSKYASPKAMTDATEDLASHYHLAENPDLLLTRAETLYTQCRFREALAITTQILNSCSPTGSLLEETSADAQASLGHNPNLYPVHLAALYETGAHNTLFHLSHTLATNAPYESYTYLAIGTYYLSTGRIAEARRFFSKASLMDPHSAPAWIGFAHTFAAEGEHDQAIAAYSTASRLFQGSHLPNLFLGMQHLALNNMQLAWEYCTAAFAMSSGIVKKEDASAIASVIFNSPHTVSADPLVVNEIGVILYHQSNLPTAARLFRRALHLAGNLGCDMTAWTATRANLAHALRRMNKLEEALVEFNECLRIMTGGSTLTDGIPSGSNAARTFAGLDTGVVSLGGLNGSPSGYEERNLLGSIHTSRGLVLLSMVDRTQEAVMALHEAVRILGGDAGGGGVAGTLLTRAMEIWAMEQHEIASEEETRQLSENSSADDDDDDILRRMPSGPRHRNMNPFTQSHQSDTDGNFESTHMLIEQRLDEDADAFLEDALNGIGRR